MLRRALGICASGLLLIVAPALAQDEDPADVLLGPTEEDTGPDYARDGFYLQIGYSYGIASKLEDQLNKKRDQFELEAQPSDLLKNQKDVPFTQTVVDGDRIRSPLSSVNPRADGPCTKGRALDPCPISPLSDNLTPSGGIPPIVAVDLSDLLRSQIGGSIHRQATPGLSPDSTFVGAGIPAMPLGIADVSNSHGINVRAGNRVLPNLAVEVQLEYMTGFEVEIPNFSQAPPPPAPPPDPAGAFVDDLNPATTADNVTYLRANDDDTIDVQLLTMTVNLKVPLLTGRIQPYGLIGGGAVFVFRDGRFPRRSDPPGATSEDPYKFEEYVNVRDVGSVFRIGGGIDTYVIENIFVSVEGTWVAAQGEAMNDLRYASITFGVGYRF